MGESTERGPSPGVRRVEAAKQDAAASPSRRVEGQPEVVHRTAGTRAEVALTFDDGPSRWTAGVAAALEENGCRGTFFIRGAAIKERREVVAALAETGHEPANHLWSHPDASKLSRVELRAEIERTAEAVRSLTGRWPRLVRPPYLKAPEAVAAAARGTGVRAVIQCSIATADWREPAPEEIWKPVLEIAAAGDIVCLHDGITGKRATDSREPTVEAVKRLVPGLLERGLRPVTVSRLLA